MKVVISYECKSKEDYLSIPEVMQENVLKIFEDGIDGSIVSYIFEISKEVFEITANIVEIAGFIYMIIRDYKGGKASVDEKMIEQNKTEEDIIDELYKSLEEKES